MISAAIEADIAELDTYEDKQLFLEDMGLDQPGVNKLIRAAYRLLPLVTYFTACVQDVRACPIPPSISSPDAPAFIPTVFDILFILPLFILFVFFFSFCSSFSFLFSLLLIFFFSLFSFFFFFFF